MSISVGINQVVVEGERCCLHMYFEGRTIGTMEFAYVIWIPFLYISASRKKTDFRSPNKVSLDGLKSRVVPREDSRNIATSKR